MLMRHFYVFVILIALAGHAYSQQIPVYNFEEFEHYLNQDNDSVYFVNFWATWCIPCVKEMPAINQIAEKYANSKVSILLVSMDMPNKIESRVIPFISKHKIHSTVVILDDPDFNSWINKVNTQWSGGIPASLVYTKKSRDFYEQSFEFEELNTIIQTKLNEL